MSRLKPSRFRSTGAQRGTTLIEVLVTMLIVALGLLGAGGMQLASVRYQQTAFMRAQATVYAQFIAEKVRANSGALNAYLTNDAYAAATLAALPADPACGLAAGSDCTSAQSAIKDLRAWRAALQALPGGRGSLNSVTVGSATDPLARQISVMWQEKQQNEAGTARNPNPASAVDPGCPAPRVAGVRCLTMVVVP